MEMILDLVAGLRMKSLSTGNRKIGNLRHIQGKIRTTAYVDREQPAILHESHHGVYGPVGKVLLSL